MSLSWLLRVDRISRVVAENYWCTTTNVYRASGVGAVDLAAVLKACKRRLYGLIRASKVKVIEVQPVRLSAVAGLVDKLVVVDAHGRAYSHEKVIYLSIGGIGALLMLIGVLIVRQAADYDRAAAIHIIFNKVNELRLKRTHDCVASILACVLERRAYHE